VNATGRAHDSSTAKTADVFLIASFSQRHGHVPNYTDIKSPFPRLRARMSDILWPRHGQGKHGLDKTRQRVANAPNGPAPRRE